MGVATRLCAKHAKSGSAGVQRTWSRLISSMAGV